MSLENLTPNQYWLLQHQITAFWHEFGISNSLWGIPEDMVETYKEKGKTFYTIKKEYMRGKLKEYIKWLKNYKESWNSNEPHPFNIDTWEKFLEDEGPKSSRADILEMIKLLQD